jgi:hypothetical protein
VRAFSWVANHDTAPPVSSLEKTRCSPVSSFVATGRCHEMVKTQKMLDLTEPSQVKAAAQLGVDAP